MTAGGTVMQFNPKRVRDNVANATTKDLLDRVTVYRSGMEPEALDLIEAELRQRGLGPREIESHALSREGTLLDAGGVAQKCAYCQQPAVTRGWRMLKLFGLVPLIPARVALCADHLR
jgi:hypothetical protein